MEERLAGNTSTGHSDCMQGMEGKSILTRCNCLTIRSWSNFVPRELMGDSVLLKLHSSWQFEPLRVGGQSGTEQKKAKTIWKQVEITGETDWTQESKSTLHTQNSCWKEDTTPTPRLKFNAVKLGVLEKTENFHVSSSYEFMLFIMYKHIYTYETYFETYCNIQTFWCFKMKIWKIVSENLTWNVKWDLWGQHQEMCLQCCVDQKRRLLRKATHEILRGDSEFALKMFKFEAL